MTGKEFAELLEGQGYNFFTGVPCSLIETVLRALEDHPRLPYLPAVREDVAVGLAAGAWLSGRRPAVLIQNSGLGTGLNALASLSLLYKLPALLVVTWRGYGGADAPEHLLTGAITQELLGLVGIQHRELSGPSIGSDLRWATEEAERRMEPVALLLPPRILEEERSEDSPPPPLHRALASEGGEDERATAGPDRLGSGGGALPAPELSRMEALRIVVGCLGVEPVIHANGYLCRESHAVADRQQNFYMIGSMGLASAIGLGLALARPDLRPVVFDGDGNLLMSLGILPMVGALRPRNFSHLVFDNEVYGSTGNQRSVSREVRLDHLAAAAGYRTARAVAAKPDIEAALGAALAQDGPHFLLIKVTTHEEDVPRIPYLPLEIRNRFRSAVNPRG